MLDVLDGKEILSVTLILFSVIDMPGSISIVDLRKKPGHVQSGRAMPAAGILLNLVIVYTVLKTSGWLSRKIGVGGLNILREVFGIILLSIAIRLFKDNRFIC